MTVTDVRKDTEHLALAITAEFDAPVERVWQLWADPRLLERWWGPPEYPATFVDHDLNPGGSVTYFMTSPEGEKYRGWWKVTEVSGPRSLAFEDGFSDDTGQPNPDMPVTSCRVDLADRPGGGTRMTIVSTFPSIEAMEQLTAMGMDERMKAAMGQMDALLDELE